MANAPVITFQSNITPFPTMSSIVYIQSKLGSGALPVLQGEQSNPVLFRVYNNFASAALISDALNVALTTYDGATSLSHTALTLPVSQAWLHVLENGFGQNSTPISDLYTRYTGLDTPVGGATNLYYAQKGSDGSYGISRILSVGGLGVGYIEYKSYLQPSLNASGGIYSFVISCSYEWST